MTITRSLQLLLLSSGYEVTVCANADEALAVFWARPQEIDAVLTDLRMPGMSGGELARRLLAQRPDLPVAVMSGYLGDWTEEKLLALGVQRVVPKPLPADELRRVVAELMGAARRSRKQ